MKNKEMCNKWTVEFINKNNMKTQSEIEKRPSIKDFQNLLDEYNNKNILNRDTLTYILTVKSIKNQLISMKNNILNDLMDTEYVDYFNWNNLMQVIDKYESLDFRITINFSNCLIEKYDENGNHEVIIEDSQANGDNKLEVVFNSLVLFAEYYFIEHKTSLV
jgi:hypothetical protein